MLQGVHIADEADYIARFYSCADSVEALYNSLEHYVAIKPEWDIQGLREIVTEVNFGCLATQTLANGC